MASKKSAAPEGTAEGSAAPAPAASSDANASSPTEQAPSTAADPPTPAATVAAASAETLAAEAQKAEAEAQPDGPVIDVPSVEQLRAEIERMPPEFQSRLKEALNQAALPPDAPKHNPDLASTTPYPSGTRQ